MLAAGLVYLDEVHETLHLGLHALQTDQPVKLHEDVFDFLFLRRSWCNPLLRRSHLVARPVLVVGNVKRMDYRGGKAR